MIEAKGGPRKHHYVSQFYLRGFTDDKKQLLVTDRPTEKVFRTNPTNVAAQRDFNTIEGEDPYLRNGVSKLCVRRAESPKIA